MTYVNTNYKGYVKDDTKGNSSAILNIDNEGLAAYKKARGEYIRMKEVIQEVEGIKQDIADIKSLLTKMVKVYNG